VSNDALGDIGYIGRLVQEDRVVGQSKASEQLVIAAQGIRSFGDA